jgi:AcrR family transcriptional regulator
MAKRRGQIVPAAVALFSERGYYRTTIQDIARRAGVSTGLIYQYAQTKEDILLLSLMSVMETVGDRSSWAVRWGRRDFYDGPVPRRRYPMEAIPALEKA